MPDSDSRQHQRGQYHQLGLARLSRIHKKDEERLARLVDLSYGGARLEFLESDDGNPHPYLAGDWVDFTIDGYRPINGRVVWTTNTVVALNFYRSAESIGQLLASIDAHS